MPTMDEKFQAYMNAGGPSLGSWRAEWRVKALRETFLAGAKVDQESVIEAIDELMATDVQLEFRGGWNEALDELKKQLEASNG